MVDGATSLFVEEVHVEIPVRGYGELMFRYIKPMGGKVILLTLLIFATIGLQLINPQIIRYFIDTASAGESTDTLLKAAVLFLITALSLQFLGVASTYVGEDVGWRSTNQLRSDLAHHCLRLDMSFHNDVTPGEMIERIDGDVADIAIFFAQFVIRILGNLLLIIGVLLVLAFVDWRISIVLTIFTILALVWLSHLRHVAIPYWRESREAHANLYGFLEEQLAGTEDTRSNGAVAYVMNRLYGLNKIRLDKEVKGASKTILIVMSWVALFTLGQIIALLSGYVLFTGGLITIGTAYLIVAYTNAIFRPLREISDQIENLQKAGAGIDRVEQLYNQQSKIVDTAVSKIPTGALAVNFDHVTFSYNDEDKILDDIDFELKPGEVLGLLGRTGSGKTTLTRLLFRLYDPTNGRIQLGENGSRHNLTEFSLHDLRHHVGMVTQDVQLFRATVRDNLTFFDDTISDERILEVIDDLGLWEWYSNLSDGLDTELETEGTSLSAGEAQLLAFTRVFLKDPGLVILDEASSRLDPATEQLIERAVEKLLKGRTGIIVAHRLGTVERADKIMILEHGRIREFGGYDHLAQDPSSRFYELLATGGVQGDELDLDVVTDGWKLLRNGH